ncbi:hypothetical protein LMJ38_08495 [Streptomyces sp. R1]|uniref:hypothetical protein n=1 Tax=Streptomyces sp. R1 TaxID=1509279 RepID=UPI001E4C4307|nr:hypothetical protein [Streptomyces sp. R1]MCC8335973.1 hypothetical protein [Streptomyces sp. R1]
MLNRILTDEPDLQPLRDLDGELADVVASCLDKDHEGRPTAVELLATAERHGPYEPPPWPRAVAESLAERAAFVTEWIPGSGSTLKSVFNHGCLAPGFGGDTSSQHCRPGTAAQRWTRV